MQRIHLMQEIPTCKLEQWSSLSDMDFVLAHKVLEDPAYAKFFRTRPISRELLLDNSYHELGFPLQASDLLEAANRCRADYVISPDKVDDASFNIQEYRKCMSVLSGYKLAVVFTGLPKDATPRQREDYLLDVINADMLCCTFKNPHRFEWFKQSFTARRWARVHLLGVAEASELKEWVEFVKTDQQSRRWSVDTGKALKWALKGLKLDQIPSWRSDQKATESGAQSDASLKILELAPIELTPEVCETFEHNVKVLRRTLQ